MPPGHRCRSRRARPNHEPGEPDPATTGFETTSRPARFTASPFHGQPVSSSAVVRQGTPIHETTQLRPTGPTNPGNAITNPSRPAYTMPTCDPTAVRTTPHHHASPACDHRHHPQRHRSTATPACAPRDTSVTPNPLQEIPATARPRPGKLSNRGARNPSRVRCRCAIASWPTWVRSARRRFAWNGSGTEMLLGMVGSQVQPMPRGDRSGRTALVPLEWPVCCLSGG
jgi:hypothetical protein